MKLHLSIIKAVSEYVFMIDEKTIYLKQDIGNIYAIKGYVKLQ